MTAVVGELGGSLSHVHSGLNDSLPAGRAAMPLVWPDL